MHRRQTIQVCSNIYTKYDREMVLLAKDFTYVRLLLADIFRYKFAHKINICLSELFYWLNAFWGILLNTARITHTDETIQSKECNCFNQLSINLTNARHYQQMRVEYVVFRQHFRYWKWNVIRF